MSDERDIRPGETLEWEIDGIIERHVLALKLERRDYDIPSKNLLVDWNKIICLMELAPEALRYRAAGVVPAREVECKRCDGHGMEVYGGYIAESCRKCDGYGQVLEFVEEVRDEIL